MVELDGKAGNHGGDLTWSWALAAAACIVEPLDRLHDRPDRADLGPSISSLVDVANLAGPARAARALLDEYDGPLDCTRFRTWHDRIDTVTNRVLATVG